MERRSLFGLLGLGMLAARSSAAEGPNGKGVRWVTERCISGNVTARELRWAWLLQVKGVDYVKSGAMTDSYVSHEVKSTELLKNPNLEHVDDACDTRNKKLHFPDYAKIPSLRRLSSEFVAKDLYGHGSWDPNLHQLLPGDVLVFALPWANYGYVSVIQAWNKSLGRGITVVWDEAKEKLGVEQDFPLVLRNRDYAPKDRDPSDDNPTRKRYIRPGLMWLRPLWHLG
jgi:hypothetical protein